MCMAAMASITSATVVALIPDAETLAENGILTLAFVTVGITLLITFLARHKITSNPNHQKWAAFINLSILVIAGHRTLSVSYATPIHQILTTDLFLLATLTAMAGFWIDRRLLWLSALTGISVVVCALVPSWTLMVIALLFGPIFFPVAYIAWTPRSLTEDSLSS